MLRNPALLAVFVALLVGGLAGYILRGPAIRSLEQELEVLRQASVSVAVPTALQQQLDDCVRREKTLAEILHKAGIQK